MKRIETPEYGCWQAMKARCLNSKHPEFDRYGGRGISICPAWLESFDTFLRDVGARPTLRHTLDRYPNPDGNYEPGNVRWATWKEQQRNRSNNRLVRHPATGEELTLVEWAERTGVGSGTIRWRLQQGWSVEKALSVEGRSERTAGDDEEIANLYRAGLTSEEIGERYGRSSRTILRALDRVGVERAKGPRRRSS